MGWSGIKNGELLDKMRQERFDVFITGDRNLQFQQHLPATGVAVVVLRAGSTRLAETLPLMKEVLEQIESLGPGTVTTISNPSLAIPRQGAGCSANVEAEVSALPGIRL